MSKATLLIVDDQKDFSTLLAEYFAEEGYDVLQAADGSEALQIITLRKPHLVLLEVVLQKIDGFELSRTLKANSETANIPIIFLTAKTSLTNKLNGYLSGGHRFLSKSIDIREVAECVKATLQYNNINDERFDGPVAYKYSNEQE